MDDRRRRFVALGDSFTEGVGDPHPRLPNGVRGWADRVADRLAKAEPGWEYANLAVRSKRLAQITEDQLAPALALRPTLITLYAGGNDILDLGTDTVDLITRYEALVDALATTGASLVLFTGVDIPGLPAPRMFLRRNHLYNSAVRRIARERGAILVDYWAMREFHSPVLWSPDRMHLSKRGHRVLAGRVLDTLGVPHTISTGPWDTPEPLRLRARLREQRRWAADWVLPLVGRKLRRVTLGDHLSPRWPDPVLVPPKGGLRRLVRELEQ
ncbi:SGNH/GDSL hydrolase family protein [Rathayibacter sp. AY2B9]|uniref:SGNH/GDSL hydrolase family protein n=1 Tax=Rathayibacter sp. AY2B9 TaxID=2080572 RepID=UPI000CE8D57D|nr:SGNH/GDSL hydrolase family protein [Rathayibacter sp. AY2B9]PPG31975.1 lipase [Rathayibacter sp. AY2B9]